MKKFLFSNSVSQFNWILWVQLSSTMMEHKDAFLTGMNYLSKKKKFHGAESKRGIKKGFKSLRKKLKRKKNYEKSY